MGSAHKKNRSARSEIRRAQGKQEVGVRQGSAVPEQEEVRDVADPVNAAVDVDKPEQCMGLGGYGAGGGLGLPPAMRIPYDPYISPVTRKQRRQQQAPD